MNSSLFIQERVFKLSQYLNGLSDKPLRELTDLAGLNKPGLYFIYDLQGILMYAGTTDRPLNERLSELRDQPKDHTFHSKHIREALERRLNRRIKKFSVMKYSMM